MTASSLNYLPQWLQDLWHLKPKLGRVAEENIVSHLRASRRLVEASREGLERTRDTEQGLIAYQDLMKAIGQYYEAEEVAGLSLPEDNNDNQGVN